MTSSFTRNQLTSESKAQLRKTVRGLRASLIAQLKESAEQRYLLSLTPAKAAATLTAAAMARRRRLDEALDQAAAEDGGGKEARARAFEAAAKEAGATLLNRLVLLRHLEALGLSKPAVVTGGWMSKGYREFQQVAPALCEDETQGMAPLLGLLFAELAVALPGLFGDVGLTSLFDVPPATLREVLEALDAVPAEAWHDDLTLGWVYQYWNDPDREELDKKIAASGKLEPHEIASKTQMFTERYMVEWLLQNSLGPTWLAMCRKHGWTPEVESSGVLAQLDARRVEWRKRREAGEVPPDALMPIEGPLEEAWKYYVPQPLPAPVVESAPDSLRELKLLDPACGSGHFLVVAFDLLVELYREEARHLGEAWSDRQVAEWILENNLHGIDIDPRAVQIAAAAVYLKARALANDADPRQVNLVAPVLKLSALAKDDAGLVRLESDLQAETGIPPDLTRQLIETLEGVDHLGSLLKVGVAIDSVLSAHEGIFAATGRQRELFGGAVPTMPLDRAVARRRVEGLLNTFLASHAKAEDLGIRLRGQQLSAGLRFASIVKEGTYHLVVGNPPYQGTSKMKNAGYVAKNYPLAKADLYAAFMQRGLQFCRPGGALAMVTLQSWMFLGQYADLRAELLTSFDLRVLADLRWCAFEHMRHNVVSMFVWRALRPGADRSVALCPSPHDEREESIPALYAKRAAVLAQVGRFEFDPRRFAEVEGRPFVYWWPESAIIEYARVEKLGATASVRQGMATSDNARFLRQVWEVDPSAVYRVAPPGNPTVAAGFRWVPYVKGAAGRAWADPLDAVLLWERKGLELKVFNEMLYGSYTRTIKNEAWYFCAGVAYNTIGNRFFARLLNYAGAFDVRGSCVFPESPQDLLVIMNSRRVAQVLEALNPGVNFQVGDVNRLPLFRVEGGPEIAGRIAVAFSEHEKTREASVEFVAPGPSTWASAQAWAQAAVDRQPGEALPKFEPHAEQPDPAAELSFEVGRALGRFPGALKTEAVLWVSPMGASRLPAALLAAWRKRSGSLSQHEALEEWLRRGFFDSHTTIYGKRPIYLPLSSAKRSFVAYVSIHRWSHSTLTTLLSDYLIPERKALEGALADLRDARASGDKKSRTETDRQFSEQSKWLEELEDFIAKVTQCADMGPPQPDASTPAREVDAPYVMDLDDGVMVNAAALWPLLEPMWKDPKKWWKELAAAKGRKDYDWSHLAARYFPTRVDEKCQKDPSLAVAHGCFWKYHPEKAYQWELRLQDELGPDFRITENDSDALRKAFLRKNPTRAAELEAAEQARRARKGAKSDQDDLDLEPAEGEDDEGEAA